MTVFADLGFLVGSAVCGVILHLSAVSLDLRKPFWRYLAGSFCGGVFSVLLLVSPVPWWCIAVGGIASVSAFFGGKNFFGTVRNVLRVFVIALLYSGLFVAVSAVFFGLSVFLGDGGGYFILSFPVTLFSAGITYGVCLRLLGRLRKIGKQPPLCDCVVLIRGKRITFRAYADTGNFLTDPVSCKPVAVVEYRVLKKAFGTDLPAFGGYDFYAFFGENARSIPYRPVSGEGRMLPAFLPDSFTVNDQSRAAVIAVSDRFLEPQGRFSGIIGPDLIGGIEDENR